MNKKEKIMENYKADYYNPETFEKSEIETKIPVDLFNEVKQTLDKKELQYQLYSDSEGVFFQAVGIAFAREKPKLDKYSEGKNPGFLPVPTVYVINDKQEIEFMYINPNYGTRLKGDLLLAVLKSL